tara:strand:+ start:137 stop:238 length:102 start_codon:yes stop_codon:yes gene_type:complete
MLQKALTKVENVDLNLFSDVEDELEFFNKHIRK